MYLWLTHNDVWQRPAQYCETIIIQLKIRKKNENKKKINSSILKKKKKRERAREREKNLEGGINLIVWSETYFRISTHFMKDFPEP